MRNFKQEGDILPVAAPYDRSSGQGCQVGAIFGVAVSDADYDAGEDVQLKRTGVFELAKTSAQSWAVGDRIYWDDSNKRCDNVATVGMLIGFALEVAANPSSVGVVCLAGSPSDLLEGQQAAIADLTMGTNVTAATANGSLEDSAATNPTEANFNNNMKELGAKVNAILAALRIHGLIAS
jgi:predicted RecA/RadA family phage recombinase